MQKRRNARALGVFKHRKPRAHDVAVLTRQRYDIGHRSYRRKVCVLLDDRIAPALDGARKLERNAHTGKVLVRVAAAFLLGVYDCHGIGDGLLTALVVVGDDKINAYFLGKHRLVGSGNAAVDADDEADTLVLERLYRRSVQTVALLDAVGDVRVAVDTTAAQPVGQKAGRGYAVDIVVAVDCDRLLFI